jgi:hypothetical protein
MTTVMTACAAAAGLPRDYRFPPDRDRQQRLLLWLACRGTQSFILPAPHPGVVRGRPHKGRSDARGNPA